MSRYREEIHDKIKQKFTKNEIADYRKHFISFDLNDDGHLSASELRKVYKCLGLTLSAKEVKDIMRTADLDENGTLSFEEFLLAMPVNTHRIEAEERRASEIRHKFMEYDRDGNGCVDTEEAHQILRDELAFTPQQSVLMVKKYDENGDGHLSYEEFVRFYGKVRSKASQIKEMFAAFDKDGSGSVSLDEAKVMLGKLEVPEEEVQGLLEIHDKNNDGELQYEEFVAFLLHS